MADFPLLANFTVLSVGISDEVSVSNDRPVARRRLFMVLRARRDIEVRLSSGESLNAVDAHLSLITGLASPSELAPELKSEDLGFLLHSTTGSQPPFIHGAVACSTENLPYHLLTPGLRTNVLLTISSLPQLLDYEEPHIWHPGRNSMLRISAYSISCTNDPGN